MREIARFPRFHARLRITELTHPQGLLSLIALRVTNFCRREDRQWWRTQTLVLGSLPNSHHQFQHTTSEGLLSHFLWLRYRAEEPLGRHRGTKIHWSHMLWWILQCRASSFSQCTCCGHKISVMGWGRVGRVSAPTNQVFSDIWSYPIVLQLQLEGTQ